jgi:hypothetical protein
VKFLLSDYARYIAGQVRVVDGGVTLQGAISHHFPRIPVRFNRATLAVRRSVPVYTQLRTHRRAAINGRYVPNPDIKLKSA